MEKRTFELVHEYVNGTETWSCQEILSDGKKRFVDGTLSVKSAIEAKRFLYEILRSGREKTILETFTI